MVGQWYALGFDAQRPRSKSRSTASACVTIFFIVRGRRAQLHELRQKLDAHHTGREAMKRQLLEKIERDIELVGLSCGRQMTREAEEAIRSQLAAVSAAVAAHCQQSDAADEVRLCWLG